MKTPAEFTHDRQVSRLKELSMTYKLFEASTPSKSLKIQAKHPRGDQIRCSEVIYKLRKAIKSL